MHSVSVSYSVSPEASSAGRSVRKDLHSYRGDINTADSVNVARGGGLERHTEKDRWRKRKKDTVRDRDKARQRKRETDRDEGMARENKTRERQRKEREK